MSLVHIRDGWIGLVAMDDAVAKKQKPDVLPQLRDGPFLGMVFPRGPEGILWALEAVAGGHEHSDDSRMATRGTILRDALDNDLVRWEELDQVYGAAVYWGFVEALLEGSAFVVAIPEPVALELYQSAEMERLYVDSVFSVRLSEGILSRDVVRRAVELMEFGLGPDACILVFSDELGLVT